jgi:hypothetical protein
VLGGAVVVAAAGAAGFELVDHGVLPGKSELDQLDGACDVPAPDFTPYATPGPQYSRTFYSAARRTTVGYTIGYPPGHRSGSGQRGRPKTASMPRQQHQSPRDVREWRCCRDPVGLWAAVRPGVRTERGKVHRVCGVIVPGMSA